jgi:hypothetical protein
MTSCFTLHVEFVAAFHDDEQAKQCEGNKSDENFPHDTSPLFIGFGNKKTPDCAGVCPIA